MDNKPASLLFVPLGKTLHAITPYLRVLDRYSGIPKRARYCALIAFCLDRKITQIKEELKKYSLYSRYYAEECNEWRGPSQRLSTCATQLRRDVAKEASRARYDRHGNRTPHLQHGIAMSLTFSTNIEFLQSFVTGNDSSENKTSNWSRA